MEYRPQLSHSGSVKASGEICDLAWTSAVAIAWAGAACLRCEERQQLDAAAMRLKVARPEKERELLSLRGLLKKSSETFSLAAS